MFYSCTSVGVYFLYTYIGGRSFVGPRTGEGDKFMTALMDHKTAHWGEGKKVKISSGFFAVPNKATQ